MNQKLRKQASKIKEGSRFYHFAPLRLAPGHIVEPGSFGATIRRYQGWDRSGAWTFGSPWLLARELQFELVRATRFPKRPSRLHCAFCLPTREYAEAYRRAVFDPRQPQFLHEVEFTQPGANTFTTSQHYTKIVGPDVAFVEATEANAAGYWSAVTKGPILEVLTLSPLRVTAAID